MITVTGKMQGMATTKQRATVQGGAVRLVLAEGAGFSSAQDIHASLRQQGTPVGLSTVYRHLQSLVEQGVADVIQSPDGEATPCSTSDCRCRYTVERPTRLPCRRSDAWMSCALLKPAPSARTERTAPPWTVARCFVVAMPCILPVTVINEPRTTHKASPYRYWLSFLLTCC